MLSNNISYCYNLMLFRKYITTETGSWSKHKTYTHGWINTSRR